jgi:hypothetical protein
MRPGRNARKAFLFALVSILAASAQPSFARNWPVASGKGVTEFAITATWTRHLRGLITFADLQKLIGSAGHLESVEDNGYDEPRARYRWIGAGGAGRIVAFQYRSGAFAAIVNPVDLKGTIEVNSFGAFVCPACSPAVNACGSRPSWVLKDIHWDSFDCPRTVTGPQAPMD